MSAPGRVVEAQLAALLGLVAERREGQCREIGEQAEARARQLIAAAHLEARQRMHQVVEKERQHARERLTEARARLQTQARHEQYRVALTMLAEGWQKLHAAIEHRWHDDAGRAAWIGALIEQALQVLPGGPWRIEHPTGWDPEEIRGHFDRLQAHCEAPPTFLPDDHLAAGLRLGAEGACLDGSLEGLLADRTTIEGRLLAGFHRRLGGNGLSSPAIPAAELPKEGKTP